MDDFVTGPDFDEELLHVSDPNTPAMLSTGFLVQVSDSLSKLKGIIKSLEEEVDELAEKVKVSQGLVERLNHLEARTTVQGKPQSKSPGKKRSNRFKRSKSSQRIARMSRQLDILIYLQLKK